MNKDTLKKQWSQNDFEDMGWHDCRVHAIAFNEADHELWFDIDYILEWIKPDDSKYYKFKVAPATLVFKDVWNLNVCMDYHLGVRIEDIHMDGSPLPKDGDLKNTTECDWRVETSNGEISFKATGYVQYIRQDVFTVDKQSLGLVQRGGISFDHK